MATDDRGAASEEYDAKIAMLRTALSGNSLDAVRLRGSDWFAWVTCGGSSVVDSSAEAGVAEVLVTASDALVLADRIDAARIWDEEVTPQLTTVELPWAAAEAREDAVRARLGPHRRVASDRPRPGELPLPAGLARARSRLLPEEIERFRVLGSDAARAMTATLREIRPQMSEVQVAAMLVGALVAGNMWPVVVLVGGARRLPLYRHPTPHADEPIGDRAMVVVCARRHGLVVNLTRMISFRPETASERALAAAVAQVEAAAFDASRPGRTLGEVYEVIADAYVRAGFAGADADHHQGGLAGYRTREEIATSNSTTVICEGTALAWSPSLPGTKLEDTAVVTADGLEIVTVDPAWPTVLVDGRARPDVLVLG